MTKDWEITQTDVDAAAELAALLPEQIVDGHAHVYVRDERSAAGALAATGPQTVDRACWHRELGSLLGMDRLTSALFIPLPTAGNLVSANEWIVETMPRAADDRLLVLSWPDMNRESLAAWLDRDAVVGIKPYHVFGKPDPTFDLPVQAYCPEWMWQVCHDRKALIMLHLVRREALADSENLRALLDLCERYSDARVVLAHAGRGFHAPNTVRACGELAHQDNIWFDCSAVCEPEPILAVLESFGPGRLIWGSDFPVSQKRGRCVTVGDDFSWIAPERIDSPPEAPVCNAWPVGLESLRALHTAADLFGLNQRDLNRIFHDNACGLLSIGASKPVDVQAQYRHGKVRMPGGTQLLSKRPEIFAPDQWPAYFADARGCRITDTSGRRFIDFAYNGIGSCLLGFRDPDVTRAVRRRINLGSMCTQNPIEELELADLLCGLHPWAQRVRYARTGGEIAVIAVRIARATTGRSKVAVCGYHGWHDWYLAANLGKDDALKGHLLPGLAPAGVPDVLRGTTATFPYNDLNAFRRVLDKEGDDLACVVMEPARHEFPAPDFLETVREETARRGILLVFDEISIGFRLCVGGAHLELGVEPDLAIFSKALGNGHPIAAVIGTAVAMEGAEQSFISSTYWTEAVGPAAALAAIQKMQRVDLPSHLAWAGARVKSIWRNAAEHTGLNVSIQGDFPCMAHLTFDHPEAEELRTLYTQEMLKRDILAAAGYYPSYAHKEREMALFEQATLDVFQVLAEAVRDNRISECLEGPVAHSGFRRLVQ